MASTPTDKAKYRRLRAHGMSHREAVAMSTTAANPDLAAPGMGALAIVVNSSHANGLLTDWAIDNGEPTDASVYSVVTAGVAVLVAGIYHVTSNYTNWSAFTTNPYVAVLRGGAEIGPYWNLGLPVPAGASMEVSAAVTLLAGDTITIATSRPEGGARMLINKVA